MMSMVSVLYLIPFALVLESAKWPSMWKASVANVGLPQLITYIMLAGLFYHLYNQVVSCAEGCSCFFFRTRLLISAWDC